MAYVNSTAMLVITNEAVVFFQIDHNNLTSQAKFYIVIYNYISQPSLYDDGIHLQKYCHHMGINYSGQPGSGIGYVPRFAVAKVKWGYIDLPQTLCDCGAALIHFTILACFACFSTFFLIISDEISIFACAESQQYITK